jgi:hypothetical protein
MTDEVIPAGEPKAEPAQIADATPDTPARDPDKVYTQSEIDAITAKVRKNERYRTRKEVEAYYQGRESVPQRQAEPQPVTTPPEDQAPSRDKFDSYEEYLDARAEYTGRKAARDERQKAEKEVLERKAQETAAERVQNFRTKVESKFPDIQERLEDVGDKPMYKGVQEAISESEFGADLFYQLVCNPSEFDRLSKMSEFAAVREIGKMEARLEAATKAASGDDSPKSEPAAVKEPSRAPTPIRPITGKTVVGDGEPSHDNPDAWRKWRERQLAAKRAGTK